MALWPYQPEVCGPTTVKHPSIQKRKKDGLYQSWWLDVKAAQPPTRKKRKQEMVIEDSCGDPHTYRIPQRRAFN
ncbi:hypothetical protein RHMOL_Rhmol05G0126200 [Rhododendron molle]|uniref:Uncharacterized protein n=1 Tax=Rhododendron molle TaxID=49168 RepID=A0ACC0NPT6_RHOML|nr:hypothetical protein RHMOL_Rhmol05G0126200 [Rhododendron molle]